MARSAAASIAVLLLVLLLVGTATGARADEEATRELAGVTKPKPKPKPKPWCTAAVLKGRWAYLAEGTITDATKKPPVKTHRDALGWYEFDGKGGLKGRGVGKNGDVMVTDNDISGNYTVALSAAGEACVVTTRAALDTGRTVSIVGEVTGSSGTGVGMIRGIQSDPNALVTIIIRRTVVGDRKPCTNATLVGTYSYAGSGTNNKGVDYVYTGSDSFDGKGVVSTYATYSPQLIQSFVRGSYAVSPDCFVTWAYDDGHSYKGILWNGGYYIFQVNPGWHDVGWSLLVRDQQGGRSGGGGGGGGKGKGKGL